MQCWNWLGKNRKRFWLIRRPIRNILLQHILICTLTTYDISNQTVLSNLSNAILYGQVSPMQSASNMEVLSTGMRIKDCKFC